MRWINLLHFYQPANIDHSFIQEALDESYYRLLRLMEENPHLRMTWNVSGCLLERLRDASESDFIRRLKSLLESGRVELTGTAAYHAFLPLVSEREVVYQIKENERILQDILGITKKPEGFFLPEMAYSKEVAKTVADLGYKWIIVDEYSTLNREELRDGSFFIDKNSGLKVLFRSRLISASYPPAVIKDLRVKGNTKDLIITATDAELYGLRHKDPTGSMEEVAAMKEIETSTISEFISREEIDGATIKEIELISSSWDTDPEDIESGKVFNLWNNENNPIHQRLWEFTDFLTSLDEEVKNDINYNWYRWHLVRGIASCTYWWASAYDFSRVFGPHAWNPDVIERGIEDMIRAVRALDDVKTREAKLEAEKYYLNIKKLIWEEHWNKHWHK